MKLIRLIAITLFIASVVAHAATPEEAGTATWLRDVDTALLSSKASGKPVFALFQEIPGCAGCKQFGRDVMSNPSIVAAIETEFTPLLIHNNKSGSDAAALKRFGEPAWNYQVVRFLDANGTDIIPRQDQVWDTGPLAQRMSATLIKAKRPVPGYLSLLASEYSPALKQAAFAMYCFWTGEMKLGQIEGVVATQAGFINGHEVTLLHYDSAVLSLPQLIAAAKQIDCAHALYLPADKLAGVQDSRLSIASLKGYQPAPASDQKKQLEGTAAAKLKLSIAQATKVNAWLRLDAAKAASYLTPAQCEALR